MVFFRTGASGHKAMRRRPQAYGASDPDSYVQAVVVQRSTLADVLGRLASGRQQLHEAKFCQSALAWEAARVIQRLDLAPFTRRERWEGHVHREARWSSLPFVLSEVAATSRAAGSSDAL